jgi:hypothetical protein
MWMVLLPGAAKVLSLAEDVYYGPAFAAAITARTV